MKKLILILFLATGLNTLTYAKGDKTPAQKAAKQTETLKKKLNLTADQTTKVKAIMLDRDIQLNTQVTRAEWQEEEGVWKVTVVHDGVTRDEYAEVLISAQGVLL